MDKSNGQVKVTRVTMAHDCGLIVNPDGLTMQLHGNIMQGISRALMEEVRFDASGVKTVDWQSYPVIRFHDIPEIETVLINRPDIPSSGGAEPSVIVVPRGRCQCHLRCHWGSLARSAIHASCAYWRR